MKLACSLGLLLILSAVGLRAEPVDYSRDIKPIVTKHCVVCHSPVRQKSGFRVDTPALLIQGGDSGPAVVPGKSAQSRLIHAVTGTEDMSRMPPEESGERLSDEEVELLRQWIDEGAKAPTETPAADPRKHWAFQPIERPTVPKVADAAWSANPIDVFVSAEHARRGLKPRPVAEPHVLLRRLYLDLTGLPPTREEMAEFLELARGQQWEKAYEAVVDRLLNSPRYGERWGRHWMDVWRYSDWAGWGQQVRDSQPHVWHWRDWIVESLNADKPYDQMVVAMLAGDELTPGDRDQLRATGYLVRNFKLLSREQWLQDTVEHTAKAFLGLTLNCARCHDHMTDPIEQTEYYQFRAIFEPHQVRLDRLPGVADTAIDALPRVFDKDLATATFFFTRGDERQPRKDLTITPGVPAILKIDGYRPSEVKLPREAFDPLHQEFVLRDDLEASEKTVATARQKVEDLKKKTPVDEAAIAQAETDCQLTEAKHASLVATIGVERLELTGDTKSDAWTAAAKSATAAQRQATLVEARRDLSVAKKEQAALNTDLEAARKAAGENDKDPKVTALATKLAAADKKIADLEAKLKQAETAAQAEPTTAYTKRNVPTYPATSSGRRLALARAIVDPRNPLAARVAVNHLWARHFDAALVPSVFNFGTSGEKPINQPLLDWLAAELMDPQATKSTAHPQAWTMKRLHRLIVTSRTYQLASTTDPENVKLDPDNRYLWRAPTRRMEAEVVRDSALYVAGRLDLTMGGPDIDHAQGLSVRRRSLYFRHAAEKQMLFLKLFDCASVGECYERRESIIPQQALALANSELTLVQARLLARQLNDEFADARAFVTAAIEQVLARPATDAELSVCLEHLTEQEAFFAKNQHRLGAPAAGPADGSKPATDPRLRVRENIIHALLNHNDFVTIR
jgi:hypothetical protein